LPAKNLDINRAFSKKEIITKDELETFLRKSFPHAAKETISWRIHDLKSKGIISNVSRGLYSLKSKRDFEPEISNTVKRLNRRLGKDFPFIQFCLWESKWFNELMVHQLFKNYIVIETEKGVMESVFNSFSDLNKMIYLNPDHEIFELYISNYEEVIIVKPLVSEAPIIINDKGIHLASLEKLLVDALIEKELFASQQNELDNIFTSVFERYNINRSKLKRYARRRNKLPELEKYISKISAERI